MLLAIDNNTKMRICNKKKVCQQNYSSPKISFIFWSWLKRFFFYQLQRIKTKVTLPLKKKCYFQNNLMLLITWEWVKARDEDRAVFIAGDFLVIVLFGTTEGVYRIDSWNDNKNHWNGLESQNTVTQTLKNSFRS